MSVAVVWIDVLPLDEEATARKTAGILADDPRIRHFHDPDKLVGKAVAKSLGWRGYAYDIYLFYPKGVTWGGELPAPAQYAHQLSVHAGDDHFHTGEDLTRSLRDMMTRTLVPSPAQKGQAQRL
ncbi:MAG TPA: hypothetical protein VGM86_20335 [Thermoanaerobaculia bacterium]